VGQPEAGRGVSQIMDRRPSAILAQASVGLTPSRWSGSSPI
jgi:hypothetical protein